MNEMLIPLAIVLCKFIFFSIFCLRQRQDRRYCLYWYWCEYLNADCYANVYDDPSTSVKNLATLLQ